MMNKSILILILFLFNSYSYGQTKGIVGNSDKICIDTLKTKLLIGKWYDFSPIFYVEQDSYIVYYVKKSTDLYDSTNYKGTLLFNSNGSFEKTFKVNDTIKSLQGNWTITQGTRQIKLTISENKYPPQTWTIIELNRNIFILKRGI
jgi:hypothetical protein